MLEYLSACIVYSQPRRPGFHSLQVSGRKGHGVLGVADHLIDGVIEIYAVLVGGVFFHLASLLVVDGAEGGGIGRLNLFLEGAHGVVAAEAVFLNDRLANLGFLFLEGLL